MYIRKKMALSTSQKILQEEAAVQKNTDSNMAAKLPEGLRSEWSSSWYHRRPHRHTSSYSIRQRRRITVTGKYKIILSKKY